MTYLFTLLKLFWSFCQIGFTSFGGMSMIPLINSEMVGHGWMTAAEVSDIVAIAEMTPGPLGLNCATFAGIRVAGPIGAIMTNFGILTPTFTVCALAALFFQRFKDSKVLKRMMFGVRPVCIGIILAVVIKLIASNYLSPDGQVLWSGVAIGAVGMVLINKFKLSVPKVIIISALLGLIFC